MKKKSAILTEYLTLIAAGFLLRSYAHEALFSAFYAGVIMGGILAGIEMCSKCTNSKPIIRFGIKLIFFAVVFWVVPSSLLNTAIIISLSAWVLSLCLFLITDEEKKGNINNEK